MMKNEIIIQRYYYGQGIKYSSKKYAPTLLATNECGQIVILNKIEDGYDPMINEQKMKNKMTIGDFRYDEGFRERNDQRLCPTILAKDGRGLCGAPLIKTKGKKMTIRKLTPRECWRLMGFDDEDFDKASKVCSKNQLYKQAGNSIVVNVLEAIFMNLFFDQKDEGYRQSNIFDFL